MAGLREERQAAGKAQGPNGAPDLPEGLQTLIRAILTRIVGLYPGAKTDATVIEDRKNMLHTIFGCEIASGMAGVQTLAGLGLDALRAGLAKLDRMTRETPPPRDTPADDGPPVHPDITATAELIASLKARAGRVGVSPETWQGWLDAYEIPRTGEAEMILSPTERGLLTGAFNQALAELKRAKAPARKAPRRKAATG
jgi:hypothetical protein